MPKLRYERDDVYRVSCQSNMKRIAFSIMEVFKNNGDKYPPAKRWLDFYNPYQENVPYYKCPSVKDADGYGYAFNSKLSEKSRDTLVRAKFKAESVVLLYETTDLNRNAYGTGENPAFRHQNGANYAFADGHVKWFPKTQTPSFKLKP